MMRCSAGHRAFRRSKVCWSMLGLVCWWLGLEISGCGWLQPSIRVFVQSQALAAQQRLAVFGVNLRSRWPMCGDLVESSRHRLAWCCCKA
jgi:hypothetical protein